MGKGKVVGSYTYYRPRDVDKTPVLRLSPCYFLGRRYNKETSVVSPVLPSGDLNNKTPFYLDLDLFGGTSPKTLCVDLRWSWTRG